MYFYSVNIVECVPSGIIITFKRYIYLFTCVISFFLHYGLSTPMFGYDRDFQVYFLFDDF